MWRAAWVLGDSRACLQSLWGLQLPPWASLQRPVLDPHFIPVLERKAPALPGPGVPGSMEEPGCFPCAVLSESKGTPFDEDLSSLHALSCWTPERAFLQLQQPLPAPGEG